MQLYNYLLKIVQRDTRDYAPLQRRATTKQTLTTSKNSIESTYNDFPCHSKVNGDKLALNNPLWNSKSIKGERLTITANSFKKIDQLDGLRPLWWSG